MREITDRDIERRRKEMLEGKKRAINTRIKEDLFLYLRSVPGDKLTEKLEKVIRFAQEQNFSGDSSNVVKRIEANYQYINELRSQMIKLDKQCADATLMPFEALKTEVQALRQELKAARIEYERDLLLRDGWCKNHLKKYHDGDGKNVS